MLCTFDQGGMIGALESPPGAARGAWAVDSSNELHGAEVALEPGDGVLFYTDGVVEAHERGGLAFGLERLTDVVGRHPAHAAPEEVIRVVIQELLRHQRGRLSDDATLVILQWDGSSPASRWRRTRPIPRTARPSWR